MYTMSLPHQRFAQLLALTSQNTILLYYIWLPFLSEKITKNDQGENGQHEESANKTSTNEGHQIGIHAVNIRS